MLKIIKEYNTNHMKRKLIESGGYHNSVLNDEVHAYALTGGEELKFKIPKEDEYINIISKAYMKA